MDVVNYNVIDLSINIVSKIHRLRQVFDKEIVKVTHKMSKFKEIIAHTYITRRTYQSFLKEIYNCVRF